MSKIQRRLLMISIAIPFLVVHLFFAIDRDGGAFLTIARGLLDGRLPYRDFFDHKPPGIYYALALPLALGHGSIWAVKVFLLSIAIVTIGFLVKALRMLEASPDAIWWGISFGALGWVIYQGYTPVTEILVALIVTSALIVLISEKHWAWEVGGFLIGLAAFCKQPSILFIIPVLGWAGFTGRTWSVLRTISGLLLAIIVGVFPLIVFGIGKDAFEQVILANLFAPPIGDLREILKGGLRLFYDGAPLWAATLLPLMTQFHKRKLIFLASMLVTAWVPAGLNPVSHYLLPAVPIGAILAALGMSELERNLSPRLHGALMLLTLFPLWVNVLSPALATFSHGVLFQQIQAGRTLADLSAPGEPIVIVAAEPQYYFFAHRYPPGKDLYLLPVNYTPNKEAEIISYLKSGLVRIIALADTPPTSQYGSQIVIYVKSQCTLIKTFRDLHLSIWSQCK